MNKCSAAAKVVGAGHEKENGGPDGINWGAGASGDFILHRFHCKQEPREASMFFNASRWEGGSTTTLMTSTAPESMT